MKAEITALGGFVPSYILDNDTISKKVNTSPEWIEHRTGIKERRIAKDSEHSTSYLAIAAIKNLFETYEVDPLEIEGVILATATPDYLLAPTASTVCKENGLLNAFGLDLNAACSGFLYALEMASAMIESGRYQKIIVAGADKMSSLVDYQDRNTCILFGDGAGAILLEKSHTGNGLINSILRTDGSGTSSLFVPAGGSKSPADMVNLLHRKHYIHQDGSYVFKKAVQAMSEVCGQILQTNELNKDDIHWLVPHQANLRIIKAVSANLNFDLSKVKINIEKYGNTTSATIPLCLWDFKDDFKEGQNMLITTFGAGFSWGAAYLRWGRMRKPKNAGHHLNQAEAMAYLS